MNQTKAQLEAEVAGILNLAEKIKTLSLAASEAELVADLVQSHAIRVKEAWQAECVERAISLLFPSYAKRLPEDEKPVRWPEKNWWWNGATVTHREDWDAKGCVVSVQSYVGGGHTDELNNFRLPIEWLEADDMEAVIKQACLKKTAELAEAERQVDLEKAQRELDNAARRLAELKGVLNGGRA